MASSRNDKFWNFYVRGLNFLVSYDRTDAYIKSRVHDRDDDNERDVDCVHVQWPVVYL